MKKATEADEFADNSITEEELLQAARRSFLVCLPVSMVRSRTPRWPIASSPRGLLEHPAKLPRLFDDLLTGVVELSDEDVDLIATALD